MALSILLSYVRLHCLGECLCRDGCIVIYKIFSVVLESYSVSASGLSGYTTTYSSGCTGSINEGKKINCTVTKQYTPTPESTTLNVVTKVDNTNGGTKQPSDFTITVSGNNPSPAIS